MRLPGSGVMVAGFRVLGFGIEGLQRNVALDDLAPRSPCIIVGSQKKGLGTKRRAGNCGTSRNAHGLPVRDFTRLGRFWDSAIHEFRVWG